MHFRYCLRFFDSHTLWYTTTDLCIGAHRTVFSYSTDKMPSSLVCRQYLTLIEKQLKNKLRNHRVAAVLRVARWQPQFDNRRGHPEDAFFLSLFFLESLFSIWPMCEIICTEIGQVSLPRQRHSVDDDIRNARNEKHTQPVSVQDADEEEN